MLLRGVRAFARTPHLNQPLSYSFQGGTSPPPAIGNARTGCSRGGGFFLHALLPAHPLPAARQGLDQSPLAHREHAKTDVISLTDKKSVLMHQHEQAEHCSVSLVCTTARCVEKKMES